MRIVVISMTLIFAAPCFSQDLVVFNVPPATIGSIEMRSNTVVNLLEGGGAPTFHAGSEDGDVKNFVVNLLAGAKVDWLHLYSGATLNVSGGEVGWLSANDESQVNLFSGSIGRVEATGSNLNISGGTIANTSNALNSHITVTGGDLPGRIFLQENSVLNIVGRDFATRIRSVVGTLDDGNKFELNTRFWDDTSIVNFVSIPEPTGTGGFAFGLLLPLVMRRSR